MLLLNFANTSVVVRETGATPQHVGSAVSMGGGGLDLTHIAVPPSVLFQDALETDVFPLAEFCWGILIGIPSVPLWILSSANKVPLITARVMAWMQSVGVPENKVCLADPNKIPPSAVPTPNAIVVCAVPPIHLECWAVVEMNDVPLTLTLQELPKMLWTLRCLAQPLHRLVPRCDNTAYWANPEAVPTALRRWTSATFRQMAVQLVDTEDTLDASETPECAIATRTMLQRFIATRCVCGTDYCIPLTELKRELVEFCQHEIERGETTTELALSRLNSLTMGKWIKLGTVEDTLTETRAFVTPTYVNRKYRGRRHHTLFVNGLTTT